MEIKMRNWKLVCPGKEELQLKKNLVIIVISFKTINQMRKLPPNQD